MHSTCLALSFSPSCLCDSARLLCWATLSRGARYVFEFKRGDLAKPVWNEAATQWQQHMPVAMNGKEREISLKNKA